MYLFAISILKLKQVKTGAVNGTKLLRIWWAYKQVSDMVP